MHLPYRFAIRVSVLTVLAFGPAPGTASESTTADEVGAPSLAVSPAVVQWVLHRRSRNGHAIRLANMSDESLEVVAELRGWRLDEAGAVEDFQPDPETFAATVRAVPESLRLDPNERRTVRLWLEGGAALDDGEHRALLVLRGQNASGEERIRLDLAIYAQLGEMRFDATLESARWRLRDGELTATFNVINRGNHHVRMDGWLRVIDAEGVVERFVLPRSPVLPGETRTLTSSQPWPGPTPAEVGMEGTLGQQLLDDLAIEAHSDEPCGQGATPLDSAHVIEPRQRQRTP